jgi:hypothetical protein
MIWEIENYSRAAGRIHLITRFLGNLKFIQTPESRYDDLILREKRFFTLERKSQQQGRGGKKLETQSVCSQRRVCESQFFSHSKREREEEGAENERK